MARYLIPKSLPHRKDKRDSLPCLKVAESCIETCIARLTRILFRLINAMESGKRIGRITVLILALTANAADLSHPQLSITRTQDNVVVSWPVAATNWVLEASPHLQAPIPWQTASSALYQTNAVHTYIAVPVSNSVSYYRLRRLSTINGLTGSWRLDDGAGSGAVDETGSAGLLALTNTTWVMGGDLENGARVGSSALHFNGGPAAGNGSRASINNHNFRLLPPSGQPFSVSLWFSPDALTTGWRAIMGNDVPGSNGWKVALHTTGPGTNYLTLAGSSLSITGRMLLLPRRWYCLAATYDGAEGRLYLNGALLGRSAGNLLTHDGPIYVGGAVGGYDSFLGRIDEVRTYTNCLSEEQISLTGRWRLDENDGNAAFDSSVNGHHGQLSANATRTFGKSGSGVDVSRGHISVPNDHFTVLPETGGRFSVSFWIYPQSLPLGRRGLMSCAQGSNNGWELTLDVETNQNWLSFASTNNGGTLNLRAPLNRTDGAWTKLDLTYNGGIATLYANGRKLGEDSGGIRASRGPVLVGSVPGCTNFNGIIDELVIYRRDRDASEIGPVPTIMWETVFRGETTNIVLQGAGPAGKPLTYAIVAAVVPTNGTIVNISSSGIVTYQAGSRKGPDAFAYTVSDGEFTSAPVTVSLSIVQPHWLSPDGGVEPRDGSSAARAWKAAAADELDAIWRTNNYYDCFFYAPGTYHTRGFRYLERPTALPGCKHIGSGSAGVQQTTLKQVDVLGTWTEESIFAPAHWLAFCDGFEVRNMLLDCNAPNLPKYIHGEPVWIRIPLANTNQVESVTLRWADNVIIFPWRFGSASQFEVCTRAPGTGSYITNCVNRSSTGQMDRITLNAATDEILIKLNRRRPGVDYYSLTEIEVAGAAVSLPAATTSGTTESRLYQHPTNSVLRAVDADRNTAWTSGSETNVEIALPLEPGTLISQINLHWNCRVFADGSRFGAASNYIIRARDPNTGSFYDVPFVRHPRSADGLEVNTFGTEEAANSIITDQLLISLTARESGVNYYSLREVALQNSSQPVSLRVPGAAGTLPWGGTFSIVQAFDRTNNTQWVCDTQGAIGAINAAGNNLKFTNLKIINFGSKAGKECFPLFVFSPLTPPNTIGNILMEDCELSQPATNNTDGLTAILLHGNRGGVTNAIVRRCTVKGVKPYFPSFSHAFVANHVENCYVENCGEAVYFEPEPRLWEDYGPVIIRSNQFINVNNGIYIFSHPNGKFRSLTGIGNEITLNLAVSSGFSACDICSVGPSGTITNVTMLDNVIRFPDWSRLPFGLQTGLRYSDIQHAVFGNNLIELGTPHALRVRQCPAGLIVPDISDCEEPAPPPPPSYPPCLDVLPSGYRRVWYNNRDLSGTLLDVRFSNNGVDGPSTQQQWP